MLLHAFIDKKIVWYSIIYGQFADNILLIGIDPAKAHLLQNTRYKETSPMEKAFGASEKFEEYQLSPEVKAALGIMFDEEYKTYLIKHEENILYQIYIHDDHFSYIKPIDQALVKELVLCVLQQHSFYLNMEVDWSDTIDVIAKEVRKTRSLLFKSQPSRSCLIIRREGILPAIKTLLMPESHRAIFIENSKAKFLKAYLKKLDTNNKTQI